jgi:hypothetical protein
LAEEYNPKTNGLMGIFPQRFSHVALETMAYRLGCLCEVTDLDRRTAGPFCETRRRSV